MDKLKILAVLCIATMFSSASTAGIRHFIDKDGNPDFEYIPGYQNPDLVVSDEDYEILLKNDKQRAREDAIEKIGKANGLSQFEISALKEESRRQFEKEIQEEQRNNVKSFNDVKLNSGKVKPAEWTK